MRSARNICDMHLEDVQMMVDKLERENQELQDKLKLQQDLIDDLVEALEVCSDWSESAHSMHEAAVTALSLVNKAKEYMKDNK